MNKAKIESAVTFTQRMYGLVSIMRDVAISRYTALKNEQHDLQKLLYEIAHIFNVAFGDSVSGSFSVMSESKNRTAIIVITSDMGLSGGLNARILNDARIFYEEEKERCGCAPFAYIIGKKGVAHARAWGWEYEALPGCNDLVHDLSSVVDAVTQSVLPRIHSGDFRSLQLFYARSVVFSLHTITRIPLVPLDMDVITRELHPIEGGKANEPDSDATVSLCDESVLRDKRKLLFESDPQRVYVYLLKLCCEYYLRNAIIQNKECEFASRAQHLEGSRQRLDEQHGTLRVAFFRARRAMIDAQIREAYAGARGRRG